MGNVKLPDEIIESFRQLYNDSTGIQWVVGDYLVDLVDEMGPMYARAKDNDDWAYHRARAGIIRELAVAVGCDTSTLRDRESMARFYPLPIRKQYDALTYHQLRACKSAGDKWQVWADWASENLPAPVALIRQRIKSNGHDQPAWWHRWERLLILAEAVRDDPEAPGKARFACRDILRVGITPPTHSPP